MKPTPDHADTPLLDADTIALLNAGVDDAALTPEVAARIRHRLLERVAQEQAGHLTVHPGPSGWKPFSAGVLIKVLHRDGDAMSYLLKLAPGAALPAHRHPMDEECVVLEGRVRIGQELVLEAGGFHLAHKGALHATIGSDEGAIIFLRGAVPHAASIV
jgi:quercetin dioxygenase-like cupin family protein